MTNPQAVEAAESALRKHLQIRFAAETKCRCDRCTQPDHVELEIVLQAAEPHIRSQLLTELAEEFDNFPSCVFAAERCRELAAKEESDG